MKCFKYVTLAMIAMYVGTLGFPAAAQGGESGWNSPWQFRVHLYGWLPDAPADITVDDQKVVEVPEDVDTILDSMNMTAMFELEAQKGPLTFFTNTVYYDGDYKDKFKGAVSGQSRRYELDEEVWIIKYGVGYRLGSWNLGKTAGSPTLALYPWVGALYFHDDYRVKLDGIGEPFDGFKVNSIFKFNTPMIGLTPRLKFSENWYLNLSASYGGWGVDHVDETYDLLGNIGYRFEMLGVSSKVLAGYRRLHIDHKKQGTELKVTAKGPYFGVGWEF